MPKDSPAYRRLRDALDGVEGWLDLSEAWQLHESARRRAAESSRPRIVEIGSWKGRSTISLAFGLAAAGVDGVVHAIDPHGPGLHGEPSTLPDLLANLERAGVRDRVEVLQMLSHEARPQFDDASVDVLYVDGAHDLEGVLTDIDDWQSALRDGAVAAFNDPGWPGVNEALRRRVAVPHSPYRNPWFSFNTVFTEFRPGDPWTLRDTARLRRLRALLALERRLPAVWQRLTPRVGRRGVAVMGAAAWGATRALLRSSAYP